MINIVTTCCLIVTFMGFNNVTNSQTQKQEAHFSVVFKYGSSFGPYGTHWFWDDARSQQFPVEPMFAYSAGVQYGPVVGILGADVLTSIEIGFGGVRTNESVIQSSITQRFHEIYFADFAIRRIPTMFWLTITTEAKLTPYIRFGAGISNTSYKEIYSKGDADIRFRKWAFTWGIGGGIQFKVREELDLALFLDDWITTIDLKEIHPIYRVPIGINAPAKMTVVGLKTVIHFIKN